MPRRARCLCESGYIHLISRGNGKQIIFEDDQDYYYYIKIMARTAREECVTICSYCLMSNHIHMLVYYSKRENVSTFMKKIGVKYSNYYNKKYERTGHLFQDRYKSELVDSESYFLTVNRYILQNPEKAGICKTADYRWSSLWKHDTINKFVDTSLAEQILGGYEAFFEYVIAENDEMCLDYADDCSRKTKYVNQDSIVLAKKILGIENLFDVKLYDAKARNEALRKLRNEGFTVRQIERLTGIGRGVIQRI